ncbi:hypothetical protein MJO55_15350 [Mycolicibacterium rufum]|uniref:Uncharacterized protein n=1 Tax=Mycolicibacterium rufum TaxID=318424 RepID=A0A9X3BNI2_9MYCO|nr:hypothetical protein [Mycolicibacterium rufum]MCV7070437.1 hypothetical protein [Mycolicibacterium rufum]ULP34713.1 hypothetical protein MJO55_15350 [Mycolicibacterium rufum]
MESFAEPVIEGANPREIGRMDAAHPGLAGARSAGAFRIVYKSAADLWASSSFTDVVVYRSEPAG